jgi:tellurite resistance protein
LKKKLFLTAASAVLTVGILAACGDGELEEPTMGEDQDFEQEVEMDEFDQSERTEEFETDLDTEVDTEVDTEFGETETETEAEFDTETDSSEDFEMETEDTEDNGL